MLRSLSYYIVYVFILALLSYSLPVILSGVDLLSPHYWLIFGVLVVITFAAYILALAGIRKGKGEGVMIIMIAFVVKLLAAMVFVLIYSKKQPSVSLQFIFNFFILYFLLTIFEILGLLRNLRHQNLK